MTAPAKRKTTPIATEPTEPVAARTPVIIAYKGFDKDLKCRDFQFEIGKTYTHAGPVVSCQSGFHACENPFDVLNYYDLLDSRFAVVEQSGATERRPEDTKIASATITIKAELSLPDFIRSAVDWIVDFTKPDRARPTGTALTDNGTYAARIASSGDGARIGSSGYAAQIGSSGYAAQIGSSGDDARIGSSGDDAQIGSSGDAAQIGSSGYGAVVACAGSVTRFRLGKAGCIAIPRYDGFRTRFVTLYEGEDGIRAGVWYALDDVGKPVECAS